MSGTFAGTAAPLDANELMSRILEVRLSDLAEELALCKALLDIADAKRYTYAYAFANIYLADSLLALGEHESCDFYLVRAQRLCREYGYDDLMLALCNVAGLYYQALNDEQSALRYFLEGIALSDKLGDVSVKGKLLGNIARGFSWRDDWESVGRYIEEACDTISGLLERGEGRDVAASYFGNLASSCQSLGDEAGSQRALRLCDRYSEGTQYDLIRRECGWCTHYAAFGDRERCLEKADKVIDLGIFDFEYKFFVYDMCIDICTIMIDLDDRLRSDEFLSFLQRSKSSMPLNTRYRVQDLSVRFCEQYRIEEGLVDQYRECYDLFVAAQSYDDKARTQSLLSQIRLDEVAAERDSIGRENRELKEAGQLDDLTGLYNRRYFKKLLSKSTQTERASRLGCLLIDVDYFKEYNDNYGHFLGDEALKVVARILMDEASDAIVPARYGGDEFICLCIGCDDRQVQEYAERVKSALVDKHIPHKSSPVNENLTLSIGWCNESVSPELDPEQLLRASDRALYHVKEQGRNAQARVFLASEDAS